MREFSLILVRCFHHARAFGDRQAAANARSHQAIFERVLDSVAQDSNQDVVARRLNARINKRKSSSPNSSCSSWKARLTAGDKRFLWAGDRSKVRRFHSNLNFVTLDLDNSQLNVKDFGFPVTVLLLPMT